MAKSKTPELDIHDDTEDGRPPSAEKMPPKDEKRPSENGEDEEEEEAVEEYEIEAIVDVKTDVFGKGTKGYFVKWKGYSAKDNSWVSEEDAQNAKELIDEFLAKRKRKSLGASSSASQRTISARKATDDRGSAVPKKRGRKPAKKSVSDDENLEPEEEEERPVKKSRTTRQSKTKDVEAKITANFDSIGSLDDKYRNKSSWEDLIERIDTVAGEGDNSELVVYFSLKGTEQLYREPAHVLRDKCPKLLVDFYESNLRWKTAEEEEAEKD
ncbi:hypothetical protein FISHEDRAFT_69425 [Fistulina hepatica ATCC 64428]|uniref:Chromo domain-containing protein n=1 Tax=Fistulina hepatica ATCC 64428 TaxID=1128425 RepID=A0A0D7ANS4_9AGAR|nr:hypothetical protein FISHEDRAFT_69425 [Fistulina hepatica ATCC 64428]